MIHTVHYEPQSQRQQFEPREQQEHDLGQVHLRLSFNPHLNSGTHLRRTSRLLVARVTTIFAAFMGALALAISPVWTQAHGVQTPPILDALFDLARHLVLAGALSGVGAVLLGGIPLAVSAWRTNPRSHPLLLTIWLGRVGDALIKLSHNCTTTSADMLLLVIYNCKTRQAQRSFSSYR